MPQYLADIKEKEFFIVLGVLEDNIDLEEVKKDAVNNFNMYLEETNKNWENITSIMVWRTAPRRPTV